MTTRFWDRIMALPLLPLLLTISLSNSCLAAVLIVSMLNDPTPTITIGFHR